MTEQEKQLIEDFEFSKISHEDFYLNFPINLRDNKNYIPDEIRKAINDQNKEALESIIFLLVWIIEYPSDYLEILHELLLNPSHQSHQRITKILQELKNPESIPYIKKVLESKFDYLEYTCSSSGTIAKWFSHALSSIGTKEAIGVLREYSISPDKEIREEMLYRLRKIKNN